MVTALEKENKKRKVNIVGRVAHFTGRGAGGKGGGNNFW